MKRNRNIVGTYMLLASIALAAELVAAASAIAEPVSSASSAIAELSSTASPSAASTAAASSSSASAASAVPAASASSAPAVPASSASPTSASASASPASASAAAFASPAAASSSELAPQNTQDGLTYEIKDSSADYGAGAYVTEYTGSSTSITVPATLGGQAVVSVYLSYESLSSLDVSACTQLRYLDCSSNSLTSLNVSENAALDFLDCGGNALTGLDVSGNSALTQLTCSGNQITSLDVSGHAALTYLKCSNNQLTSLDVSGCTALEDLRCFSNQLGTLDVSAATVLQHLDCFYNKLGTLGVSGNAALEHLDCDNNQLTALDVSGNGTLTELYCYDNGLTSLNVSGCAALETLSCFGNRLGTLDVSGNVALAELFCEDNELKSLDVSANTALTSFTCYNNYISDTSALTTRFGTDQNVVLPQKDLSSNDVARATASVADLIRDYAATPLAPSVSLTLSGTALVAGTDYDLVYTGTGSTSYGPSTSAPSAAGTYAVAAAGKGVYFGDKPVGTLAIHDVSGAVAAGTAYRLHSAADSDYVLDVAGAVPQLGANVSIWTSNGGKNQCFTFEADGDGHYVLRNVADASLVLDAAGNPAASGANVSTWTYNGGANQKWALVPQGDGTYAVASACGASLVLDAAGAQPSIGANVSIYASNGGANQRWTLEDASSISGASVALSGNVRDYPAGSTFADVEPTVSAAFGAAGTLAEGTDFQVSFRGADGTEHSASDAVPAAGKYDVVLTGTGAYHGEKVAGTLTLFDASSAVVAGRSYRIRSAASSASDPYILDVAGNVPRLGANISIWTDNGGANQCFTFELGTDGYYTVRNLARPDFVLDAAGYPPAPGANVSTWSENGFGNQRWVLVPGADASGTPDGTWTIATAYDSSLVLDAAGAQPSIGANVSAWTSNGGANQSWLLEDGGVDLSGIAASSTATGMVRDATGSPLAPTVTVSCNGRTLSEGTDYALSYTGTTSAGAAYGPTSQAPSAAGTYEVSAVGTGSTASGFHGSRTVGTLVVHDVSGAVSSGTVYRIHSASDGAFVLDVAGASPVLGSNVSIWTSNGGANQCFTFEPDGDGYYVLRNVANTSLVLDAAGAQPAIGANVSTWTSNGGMNQRWIVVPGTDASGTPDGTYAIASACDPSLVLDAAGAQPTIGANVSVWTSNGGANQRWTLEVVDPATLGAATASTDAPSPEMPATAVADPAADATAGSGSGSGSGSTVITGSAPSALDQSGSISIASSASDSGGSILNSTPTLE